MVWFFSITESNKGKIMLILFLIILEPILIFIAEAWFDSGLIENYTYKSSIYMSLFFSFISKVLFLPAFYGNFFGSGGHYMIGGGR